MLTNSLKVSHTSKRKLFELIFFQRHQKIWQKYCRADLSGLLLPLTYWPSINVLKRDFFGMYVTPLFWLYNFRKKSPIRLIFTLKLWQFYVDSRNRKKIGKIFFDCEVNLFELVALNTRFGGERILVVGCQYVNKQSQDFRYY